MPKQKPETPAPVNDTIIQPAEKSYFETRIIEELGITKELNTIELIANDPTFDTDRRGKFSIFFPDKEDNICIRVFNVKREIQYYYDKRSDKDTSTSNRWRPYVLTRLKHPVDIAEAGRTKQRKYNIPKGGGTFPFITPGLIDKYENDTIIETLVLTEGYFKAFKGYMHGLDIVGLSSITHVKDKDTEMMYADVVELIQKCKVKTVIMLYDGDCRNISTNALADGDDLILRPSIFLASCKKVAELLKDYKVSIYFAAIESAEIEGNPKGLDDLYLAFKEREPEITDDLIKISRVSRYFKRIDITANTNKVVDWFHIRDVNDFYRFHADTIKESEFVFRGSRYVWNQKDKVCDIRVPKNVLEYFQVGDNYYKFVKVPNKYKQDEVRVVPRQLTTIKQLIGKQFIDHIPYYEEFCNVPEHVSYAQVINNCFNLYNRFEHEPEDGDCQTTIDFIRHIFGDLFNIGMDYIQLLYQKPTQKLPILCLVSAENQTGKSTFIQWLKNIFTTNAVIVGNDDLTNQFNYSWASKLLVCCEETIIDKRAGVEKIKALSTGDKIMTNRKGKDQSEIDFFGKFILASNNEDNFIIASKNDQRYMVIKVPTIKKKNPNLLKNMTDEIPAFLHYLNQRTLTTQNEDRMWFKPEIRHTEALEKLIEANRSGIESELDYFLRDTFKQFGFEILLLSADSINQMLFNRKYPPNYISRKIKELFKVDSYRNADGKEVTHRFFWPRWTDDNDPEVDRKITFVGKPYVFNSKDYLTKTELEEVNKTGYKINNFSEQKDEFLDLVKQTNLPF
jgi:hypothetical protein